MKFVKNFIKPDIKVLVLLICAVMIAVPDASAQDSTSEVRFDITDGTRLFYRVNEQLVGVSFRNDVVGITENISGAIVVNRDGTVDTSESQLIVDLRTFSSDQARRDNYVRTTVFEVAQARGCQPDCELHSPEAVFVPRRASSSPLPPEDGEGFFPIVGFELIGDMTLHGVTQEITWEMLLTYNIDAGIVEGKAQTSITFDMFDLTKPSLPFLLTVEDEIRLELDFKASLSGL